LQKSRRKIGAVDVEGDFGDAVDVDGDFGGISKIF
jgi:hypothetical protein